MASAANLNINIFQIAGKLIFVCVFVCVSIVKATFKNIYILARAEVKGLSQDSCNCVTLIVVANFLENCFNKSNCQGLYVFPCFNMNSAAGDS